MLRYCTRDLSLHRSQGHWLGPRPTGCECRPSCAGTRDTRQETRRCCGWHSSKRIDYWIAAMVRTSVSSLLNEDPSDPHHICTHVAMWSKLKTQGYGFYVSSLYWWFRPRLIPKNFQDSPSHQMFGHMHRALNVDEKKNQLHSLVENRETNLLSLISPWLDTNW
jgi:hypothetical protein